MELNKIYCGNNIDVLKTFEDNSIDSVVTDPPYGISFMNKHWDYDVPSVETWKEVLRVLKPGGHALVACGTRTQHRMAVNLEDAGFEIRDIVAWIYGSGFPKSLDISKAIDKKEGVKHPLNIPISENNSMNGANYTRNKMDVQSDLAKQYEGFGTALKPAMELWTLCRKPIKGTVAENVLKYGTGGLNIDGCRVGTEEIGGGTMPDLNQKTGEQGIYNGTKIGAERKDYESHIGRFPANVIHDGSEEVVKGFPNTDGGTGETKVYESYDNDIHFNASKTVNRLSYAGDGSAARFFYTAKASQSERNRGLYGFEEDTTDDGKEKTADNAFQIGATLRKNFHPTVKPLDLMQYLCRLITPKGATVLDPFCGSGSTCIAAKLERMNYIGIELDEKYVAISEARIKAADVQYDIFDFID